MVRIQTKVTNEVYLVNNKEISRDSDNNWKSNYELTPAEDKAFLAHLNFIVDKPEFKQLTVVEFNNQTQTDDDKDKLIAHLYACLSQQSGMIEMLTKLTQRSAKQ
jgi:hypothetical protein